MIDKTISHYQIIEKLGEGGMGVVYKARDTKLKRTVALKFLPPELTRDPDAKKRFIHEAQSASVLDHPNICTVYEIGETDDGQMFLAMALYEGETLKEKVERSPVKLADAMDIAIQIARGLSKAHENKIVHRDIKAANIFVTSDGLVKILDFGLAKLSGRTRITKEDTTLGTVSYMSPEQARGEEVDQRSDIWSLGVVLYEMLTGQLPFKGDYDQGVIYAILNEEITPVKSLRKEIPEGLDRIVRHALIKDVESRYGTVGELIKDLKQFMAERKVAVSGSFESSRIIRRKLKLKILIPVVLCFIVLGLALTQYINRIIKVKWAGGAGISELNRMVDNRDYSAAYPFAQKLLKLIPEDSTLIYLWSRVSRSVTFETDPPGADIYFKEYNAVNNPWKYLGKSPLNEVRIPIGFFRWKIEKEEFQTIQDVHTGSAGSYHFVLDESGSLPEGMVKIHGDEYSVYILSAGFIDVKFDDYLMDQYEVSNRQFKHFVDAGGYQNPEFWKNPFIKDREKIDWEEAMAVFTDATGRQGPATWELGTFPEGQGDHPVGGVSWYEAAAYAEFSCKRLPTVYHWRISAATEYSEYIIPLSNFGESGTAPVGSYKAISYHGTYDMAGNVREWCSSIVEGKRIILGGAWNDPYYMFYILDAKPPFDRSPENGFRCIEQLSAESTSEFAEKPVVYPVRDYSQEKPVADDIFQIYAGFYSYDKIELNPQNEFSDDSSPYWRKEKISFEVAYGNERMSVYLFLPKNANPPYQTIILFPGAGVFGRKSSENGNNLWSWSAVDFVLKSGRAVLYPIYKSTYERFDNYQYYRADVRQSAYRDRVITWSKELGRALDYLEVRPDIDSEKICYAGSSWGAAISPMLLAMEKRFKASYLILGGFWLWESSGEVDQINFAPRVTIPVLMINGRYDYIFPYETSQIPMFQAFGTQDEYKRHRLFDEGHSYPRQRNEFIREVLDWLDTYLGPVQ